jgi:hypothetical protein
MIDKSPANYVKQFQAAKDYLEMLTDPLEIWFMYEKCPDWKLVFPVSEVGGGLGCAALGPITRNERLEIGTFSIKFTDMEGKLITIPYESIYNLAVRGEHPDLNWWTQGYKHDAFDGLITYYPFFYPAGGPDEFQGPAE